MIFKLDAGSILYRVHRKHRSAISFVPPRSTTRIRLGRFDASPEEEFPHYYCALNERAALAETLLRDIPQDPGRHIVLPRHVRENRWLSAVEVTQDLALLPLLTASTQRAAGVPSWISSSDEETYPETREFGFRLRLTNPWAQGLLWPSRRDPVTPSLILFGDRCDEECLQIVKSPLLDLDDDSNVEPLNELLLSIGVELS